MLSPRTRFEGWTQSIYVVLINLYKPGLNICLKLVAILVSIGMSSSPILEVVFIMVLMDTSIRTLWRFLVEMLIFKFIALSMDRKAALIQL